MRAHAPLAALAFALALGCAASPRWEKPEATPADYQRDSAECMQEASGTATDPSASTRARVQSDFEDCMESRGWAKR